MTWSRRSVQKAHTEASRAEFEALFNQHWEPLCRVLYQLTGDAAEAEDLALEALLQLYHRPPTDQRNLSGWLYRVATNLGLNALRSRKRRQRYETEAGDLDLQMNGPEDPAIHYELWLERERVRAVLRSIKPRSAQILVLRHSGLAYAEIAAALGIASSSVGTLLVRAEQEFERAFKRLLA
jgi:RNA polymerase sigma-70 factor (ECF subfamily)